MVLDGGRRGLVAVEGEVHQLSQVALQDCVAGFDEISDLEVALQFQYYGHEFFVK